jgi:hypothetical protein
MDNLKNAGGSGKWKFPEPPDNCARRHPFAVAMNRQRLNLCSIQ